MKAALPHLSRKEFHVTLRRVFAALKACDDITLRHFQRAKISHKADGSEVTVADKGGERLLRRRLRAAWPKDAILGEEYGGTLVREGRCWLLDPIDGTASYVLGLPMFGTLISLLIDAEPVFGCIHLAALKETTYAARGHGCWLKRAGTRPRRVRVAPSRPLAQAQIGLTSLKQSDLAPSPDRGGCRSWRGRRGGCVWWGTACSTRCCAVAPSMAPSTR